MKDLILLHGALGHSKDFDPYEALLSPYFNIHKILFQGHGGTEIPEAGLNIEGYVRQVQQYVAAHQLNEVHIFGYSMGGYVALRYAFGNPGKVASVLTLATKLEWTADGVLKETKMLDPELIQTKVPKYAAQLRSLHGEKDWALLLPAIAQLMQRLAGNPLLGKAEYESLNIPVQMMVGDKDAMVSMDETLDAVRNIANAGFAVLPHTKHSIDAVRVDLLTGLMLDFWKV
jgi:pimeloyl-ACP methyl ester carboxylesterase